DWLITTSHIAGLQVGTRTVVTPARRAKLKLAQGGIAGSPSRADFARDGVQVSPGYAFYKGPSPVGAAQISLVSPAEAGSGFVQPSYPGLNHPNNRKCGGCRGPWFRPGLTATPPLHHPITRKNGAQWGPRLRGSVFRSFGLILL